MEHHLLVHQICYTILIMEIPNTYSEMHNLLINCSTSNPNYPKQCVLDFLDINESNSPFIDNTQVMVYNINETYMDYLNLKMISINNTENIGGYTIKGLQNVAQIYCIQIIQFYSDCIVYLCTIL